MKLKGKMYFDGSAEPTNPGAATGGAYLEVEDGRVLTYSQFLGKGSNNSAEYGGLILGSLNALKEGITHIQIYGDSKLVVNCVNGAWRSKQAHLTLHIQQARMILDNFEEWKLIWIPREKNLADPYSRVRTSTEYGTILSSISFSPLTKAKEEVLI